MAKLEQIRNIGIIAHIDAGKTTTSERLLYQSGRIHRMGEVHDGDTTMDWREDEQQRGITIAAAASTFYWNDCTINLIDTPGHVDFTAEVERSMRVIDGAIVVLCGVGGVEAQSETVWRQAEQYKVPRICFINKLDRAGSDFDWVVSSIRDRLGGNPIPIQIPWLDESENVLGVIDLVRLCGLTFPGEEVGDAVTCPVPQDLEVAVENARSEMIESLADIDDEIAESFLAEDNFSTEQLEKAIRRCTLANKCVPVLAGSALRNIGVQPLLDAVVSLLPSPVEVPPQEGRNPRNDEHVTYRADTDEPFSGLVFKVQVQTSGDLFFLRVYSGVLSAGDAPICARTTRRDKVHDLLRMHAKSGERLKTVGPGEIVAIPGLKQSTTGDTLHAAGHPVTYEPISFPEPVISIAVEPRTSAGREKLLESLDKLSREDPTLTWLENDETGQTIVSGMGELHLEIATNRLAHEFKVDANIGKPRVAYRETVAKSGEISHEAQRQIGGNACYGGVTLALAPADDLEAEWAVPPLVAAPKGSEQSLVEHLHGELLGTGNYGHPLRGVRAEIRDIRTRDVDPQGIGLPYALSEAFQRALQELGTTILEPVMRIEIATQGEFVGAVHRTLQGKRAAIEELQEEHGLSLIMGKVPMSEMFGFSGDLRTISQGRASFSMKPAGFQAIDEKQVRRMYGG